MNKSERRISFLNQKKLSKIGPGCYDSKIDFVKKKKNCYTRI